MNRDLSAIPLIDHHCHTIVDGAKKADIDQLLRATSEAPGTYPIADLKERLVFQAIQQVVREATGEPVAHASDLQGVLESLEYQEYCKQLYQTRHYQRLFVDTGYTPESGMPLEELGTVTGTSVSAILRLETVAEQLKTPGRSFADWWDEFQTIIKSARHHGFIGAKSIIAYRTGLEVYPVAKSEAKRAYEVWCLQHSKRLTDQTLLNFILWESAPILIEQSLPLQLHTGYGDPDTDLRKGNPLHLRAFIEEFCTQGLAITLLHTYPYQREAGYLASVYPNVYFDVSLIIPLGPSSANRVVAEALDLTPMSRFLFASDAHTRPELFALASDLYRQALDAYFTNPSTSRFLSPSQIYQWYEMILHSNARRLYLGKL